MRVRGTTASERPAAARRGLRLALSERLRELGGKVENGLPMLSHVREDRGLITGQNPKSSEKAAGKTGSGSLIQIP